MICVYDRMATRFEGHGLGVLHPSKCEISEETGGAYELAMEHPLTESGEALLLEVGVILQAPGAPKREAGREQLFRVTQVARSEDGESVSVQARHITYDLMYNCVKSVVHTAKTAAGTVAGELMAALEDQGHGFTLSAPGLTAPVSGSWEMCNGISALLDQEAGLVRMARARLIRDNHAITLLPEDAPDSGVVIRYGSNMTGLTLQEDDSEVYTRLIPVGESETGERLYLPERQIDSPRLGEYPRPRVTMWQVTGARVGAKPSGSDAALTKEDVYGLLREAAQEKLAGGVDQPRRDVQAGYIDLGATEEYAAYGALQTVCLYDLVTIRHDPQGLRFAVPVSGYTWDAIGERYTLLKLGDVYADKTADVVVTKPQLTKERRRTNGQLAATDNRLVVVAEYIDLVAEKQGRDMATATDWLNRLEIEMDAQAGVLALKADRTEVSAGMASLRSEVGIWLDAVNSSLELKASRVELQQGMETVRTQVGIELDAMQGAIELRVTKDGIASAINQTAQSVRIQASKIDLDGYVTASQLSAELAEINRLLTGVATISAFAAGQGTVSNLYVPTSLTFQGYAISRKTIRPVTSVNSPTFNYTTLQYKDHDGNNRSQVVLTSVNTAASGNTTTYHVLGHD